MRTLVSVFLLTAVSLSMPATVKAETMSEDQKPHCDVVNRARGLEVLKEMKKSMPTPGEISFGEDAESSDTPITTVSGTSKDYVVSTWTYVSVYGYTFAQSYSGMVGNIVFDSDNGVAYMRDPIPYFPYETYMVGTYSNTSMKFHMPQAIITSGKKTYYLHRMVMDDRVEGGGFTIDDSEPMEYKIGEDGVITDNFGYDVMLGLTDENGEWLGSAADFAVTMKPLKNKMLTISDMPSDFTKSLEHWAIAVDDSWKIVRGGRYNGKAYIAGLNPSYPDALIEGTIKDTKDGDRVIFPSQQVLGIDTDINSYQFFYGVLVRRSYDNYYEKDVNYYTPLDSAEFWYDEEDGLLVSESCSIGVFSGNLADPYDCSTYALYEDPDFEEIPEDVSLEPKPAYDLQLHDSEDEAEFLTFTIDAMNKDGWPLDSGNLYYRLYDGDKVFVFSPEHYYGLKSNMTDLGYSFSVLDEYGYYDIFAGSDELSRYVYLYYSIDNPGVQTVYKEDGVDYCSKIVYLNDTAVKDIAADKTIVSEHYTDLSGREVVNPQHGLYLRTVKYSDGSQSVDKVMKR
jgi:hypothetical protein